MDDATYSFLLSWTTSQTVTLSEFEAAVLEDLTGRRGGSDAGRSVNNRVKHLGETSQPIGFTHKI
jgi:hypothetical protein